MNEDGFQRFLRDTKQLGRGTVSSYVSNCRRVERHEGGLDEHFLADHCAALLGRLEYTVRDARERRPQRHAIPISGSVMDGTSTLKRAIRLYLEFLKTGGAEPMAPPGSRPEKPWPEWPQPDAEDLLRLVRTLTPTAKFLSPGIVGAVAEDNRRNGAEWYSRLGRAGINPEIYLWEGSPCAFPGVRRHETNQELAWFGRSRRFPGFKPADCIKLDESDYPRHLWTFVFTGRPFRLGGPAGYGFAHLADHRRLGDRWREEFDRDPDDAGVEPPPVCGLYASAANTACMPAAFVGAGGFPDMLRLLMLRRAYRLYGDVCRPAPPPLIAKDWGADAWSPDDFEWGEPVGTTEHVPEFLAFRRREIDGILDLVERRGRPA